MPENDPTNFKNLTAFVARFLLCFWDYALNGWTNVGCCRSYKTAVLSK